MPPRSEKQRRAMHAAAKGQSTIGIPKSVGREFVGAPRTTAGRTVPTSPQQQTPQQSPQLQQAIMNEMMKRRR